MVPIFSSADGAAAVFAAAVGVGDRGGGAVGTDHRLFGRLLLPALLAGAQQRPLDLIRGSYVVLVKLFDRFSYINSRKQKASF